MKEIRLCDNGELDKVLPLCIENNLGIEFQSFADSNLIGTEKSNNLIKEHKYKTFNFNGGKSLHAPFKDLCLASQNLVNKEDAMRNFNYAYKVAKELGCSEIVVHNGYNPNTSFYDGWVKRSTIFWKEFFSDKDNSIRIMIENQNEVSANLINMVINEVNDDRLKACLDIGHAHANSLKSVKEWIKTLGENIGYLHLHNNHGKQYEEETYLNDEHLDLNNGTIDMKEIFELLEEYCPNAIWNIETKTHCLEASISYLQELGHLSKNKVK